MMFVALDKLANQGVRKVIVAVPQQNIGRSFNDTPLKKFGFFEDSSVAPYWNLCMAVGSENSKKSIVREFLDHPTATKLVCTHATLLNSLNGIDARKLDNVFFGIDEFHHGSADEDNRLGTPIRRLLNETSAHILAMTGSYFRGDAVPVMRPEDEDKSGEKLAESEENLLEHRTDGTDAFDILYIGCEKFTYHDSFSLSMSGVI